MALADSRPLLTIVIVSYNTETLTLQTLRSVFKDILASPLLAEQHQVIVVDNASTDNSVPSAKRLHSQFPETALEIITNKENLGFAAANNQAFKKAHGKYILLLNSDTLVQTGALEKMVSSMEMLQPQNVTAHLSSEQKPFDNLGILAATLLNWDGTEQPQGGDLPTLLTLAMQQLFLDDLPIIGKYLPSVQKTGAQYRLLDLNEPAESQQLLSTGWVGGTAMLIRSSVLAEIGPLDENIFMYGEDVEFCVRARKHHIDVAQHPSARITHFQNASSSSRNAILGEVKGMLYLWSKHKPIWQYQFARGILIIGTLLRVALFTLLQQSEKTSTYNHALEYLKKHTYV